MGAATVEPVPAGNVEAGAGADDLGAGARAGEAPGAPHARGAKPGRPSRRVLVTAGAGAGVAGLLATPSFVALWRHRDSERNGIGSAARSNSSAASAPQSGGSAVGTSRAPEGRPSTKRPPTPTGPAPEADRRWKARVAGADSYPDLTIAGGMVLAWTDSHVRGVDPRTGRVRWKRVANDHLGGVADGVAYVIGSARSSQWQVSALRAASGARRWAYKPSTGEYLWHGPAATGSVVCFGGELIRALDVDDGRLRWTAEVGADNGLAAGDGLVVAVGSRLVGVDARDGRKSWTYAVDDGLYPHVADGRVFVCDGSDTLHAIDADTGRPAWQRPNSHSSLGLQFGSGRLFLSTPDGDVFALDAATGSQVWSRRLGDGEGAAFRQPNAIRLSGDRLYAACPNQTVYALDAANGLVLWTYDIDPTLSSGPVSTAGLVFVGTNGHVHALVPPSGGDSGGTRAR
jgi:outer membrane protein assembly factor BamB